MGVLRLGSPPMSPSPPHLPSSPALWREGGSGGMEESGRAVLGFLREYGQEGCGINVADDGASSQGDGDGCGGSGGAAAGMGGRLTEWGSGAVGRAGRLQSEAQWQHEAVLSPTRAVGLLTLSLAWMSAPASSRARSTSTLELFQAALWRGVDPYCTATQATPSRHRHHPTALARTVRQRVGHGGSRAVGNGAVRWEGWWCGVMRWGEEACGVAWRGGLRHVVKCHSPRRR